MPNSVIDLSTNYTYNIIARLSPDFGNYECYFICKFGNTVKENCADSNLCNFDIKAVATQYPSAIEISSVSVIITTSTNAFYHSTAALNIVQTMSPLANCSFNFS